MSLKQRSWESQEVRMTTIRKTHTFTSSKCNKWKAFHLTKHIKHQQTKIRYLQINTNMKVYTSVSHNLDRRELEVTIAPVCHHLVSHLQMVAQFSTDYLLRAKTKAASFKRTSLRRNYYQSQVLRQ